MPISIPQRFWHYLSRAQLTALAPAADTDGCTNIDCGMGASCADVAAPGMGYECACEANYDGNTESNGEATCTGTRVARCIQMSATHPSPATALMRLSCALQRNRALVMPTSPVPRV